MLNGFHKLSSESYGKFSFTNSRKICDTYQANLNLANEKSKYHCEVVIKHALDKKF